MNPKRIARKIHPISVGIQKQNVRKRLFSKAFTYERTISGFDKPFLQRVKYTPMKGIIHKTNGDLWFRVFSPTEKNANVANLFCEISTSISSGKRQKVADLNWVHTEDKYKNKGLMTHLVTEATHTLKLLGVKEITTFVVSGHESILKELGYTCTKRNSDGAYYTIKFN